MAAQVKRSACAANRKTATQRHSSDIALVLDTACWSKNFDYGSANHRQIGAGPMLVLYDKTLIAPAKLIALAETIARSQGIPLQDMFSNGGTDGGAIISPALACRLLCWSPTRRQALRGIHCRPKRHSSHPTTACRACGMHEP